jgi:hypothetical protein
VTRRSDQARQREVERPVPTKRGSAKSKHFLQLATPKSHFKRAEHRSRWCVALMRCDGLERASKKESKGRREKS